MEATKGEERAVMRIKGMMPQAATGGCQYLFCVWFLFCPLEVISWGGGEGKVGNEKRMANEGGEWVTE